MEYRIEEGPELRLAGIGIKVGTKEGENFTIVPAFWDEIMRDGRFKALAAKADLSRFAISAVCHRFDMATGTFIYSIAIDEPESMEGMPAGSEAFTVPASTWGKFTSRGPIRPNFQDMIKRIFSEWLPASDWEHAGSDEIEYYPEGDTESPDYWCEYWIPLKKGKPSR